MVTRIISEDSFSENIRTAKRFRNKWYDEYTGEEIIADEIKKLDILYKEETIFNDPIVERVYKGFGTFDAGEIYIYGKFIPHWKRMTFYNDGKRRKIAQKRASSMDRQNIRKWISDEDWAAEVKNHALSKSILWEIY